ncbi:uncharacterized protein LOC135596641 [Musa acuminata AAA Group]|uniref:uncharacterized protein LOC103972581 n=1 Tax=Musa acuminata AAA Group TaxID=214697 RepID=UPI0031D06079
MHAFHRQARFPLAMYSSSTSSTCASLGVGDPTGLSDDLLMDILVRLPLRSLIRCNSVCRSWRRLISDGGGYLQTRLPLIASAIFYRCGVAEIDDKPSLGSTLHVANPTTRRWIELPKPRRRSQLSILAFDPCHSAEYRVVSFTGWLAQGAKIEVFASHRRSWVEHQVQWGLPSDAMSTTIRYFDGVLYILAYPDQVVGIDLTTMACRKIELPEATKQEGRVGRSSGRLCYSHRAGDQLKIWVLGDPNGGDHWLLRHVIGTQKLVQRCPETSRSSIFSSLPINQFKFLGFHPQREMIYLWLPGKIVSYDLGKRLMEEAYEFGKETEGAFVVQLCLYPFSSHVSDCVADVRV